MNNRIVKDKFLGCLLGAAIGDAMGQAIGTTIYEFEKEKRQVTISLGGDTDTTASMAGAISGAYLGIDAIPSDWIEQVENRDYISRLAHKLWQVSIKS